MIIFSPGYSKYVTYFKLFKIAIVKFTHEIYNISNDKILQESVKPCKFFNFRASIMYRCECIKRNGLQDRCMMWNCMGRPECMTKLYPICEPGYSILLKLTDLGDMNIALKKFYCMDQAREAALAAYCRLVYDKVRQRQILCNKSENIEALCTSAMPTIRNMSNARSNSDSDKLTSLNDFSSLYRFCVPSTSYVLQSCNICCSPYN